MKNNKNIICLLKTNLAFTLVEALLAMAIVGVVAGIVIPKLISNVNDAKNLALLKQDFDIIQQALVMAEAKEGIVGKWYLGEGEPAPANNAVYQNLSKYIKISKYCGTANGCFSTNKYKWLSSDAWFQYGIGGSYQDMGTDTRYEKMILENGSALGINVLGFTYQATTAASSITVVDFVIDINGPKEPNRWGYDTFLFKLNTNPYAPSGNQTFTPFGSTTSNNIDDKAGCYSDAPSGNKGGGGVGCAVWAIQRDTVKYKNGELLPSNH